MQEFQFVRKNEKYFRGKKQQFISKIKEKNLKNIGEFLIFLLNTYFLNYVFLKNF